MPIICTFYGVVIRMFWRDHNPPHFHAFYGGDEAVIEIHTLKVVKGNLPRRALIMVLEWAQDHREELSEDWTLCSTKQPTKTIAPLP